MTCLLQTHQIADAVWISQRSSKACRCSLNVLMTTLKQDLRLQKWLSKERGLSGNHFLFQFLLVFFFFFLSASCVAIFVFPLGTSKSKTIKFYVNNWLETHSPNTPLFLVCERREICCRIATVSLTRASFPFLLCSSAHIQ